MISSIRYTLIALLLSLMSCAFNSQPVQYPPSWPDYAPFAPTGSTKTSSWLIKYYGANSNSKSWFALDDSKGYKMYGISFYNTTPQEEIKQEIQDQMIECGFSYEGYYRENTINQDMYTFSKDHLIVHLYTDGRKKNTYIIVVRDYSYRGEQNNTR